MTTKTDLAKAMAEAISKTKIFGEPTPEEAELEAKIQEVLDSPEYKEMLDYSSKLLLYSGMSVKEIVDEMKKEGVLILPTNK